MGVQADSSDFRAPVTPPISFFWATFDDGNLNLPNCAGFQVFTTNNSQAATQPVLPFYFTAAAVGYEPQVMQVPVGVGGQFTWNAAYPTGTKLTLAMTDSANNSGGAVDGYSVVPGYNNCTVFNSTYSTWGQEHSAIGFTTYPYDRPCDEIVLKINGGTAPYTVSVLAGTSGTYANLTDVGSKEVKLKNVVPAGQTFHLFVTDANGYSSGVSEGMTSSLNLASCNSPDPPSSGSSTPIGAIVGGVIGGVAAAALIALLAWWLVRRRNARTAEQYRREQALATSEFRTADGRAPLVEPFNVPLAASAVGMAGGAGAGAAGEYDDHSPTSGDGSYDKSLAQYPSSPSGEHAHLYPHPHAPSAVPPPPPALYSRHPSDHASSYGGGPTLYDPYSDRPYPSYDSTATSGTAMPPTPGSYQPSLQIPSAVPPSSSGHAAASGSPTEPHPSSLALRNEPSASSPSSALPPSRVEAQTTDGLANPEEFTYRVFDPQASAGGGSWPHGGGGGLPPGAGRY
ncbi:hypothetical protein JCM10213_002370 [Rhodosporidiobolus nylandii]